MIQHLYFTLIPRLSIIPPSFWLRGYSSAGRALAWHARGQRFDPAYLHQTNIFWSLGVAKKPFSPHRLEA